MATLYDHVIVPFDGTATAQAVAMYAADLARVLHARLQILTSAEVGSIEGLDRLKARAEALDMRSVDVWVDAQARPAQAVAVSVEHRPRSLVCMATHARGGLRKVVAGSVAEDVLRAVDVPVLLCGPRCTPDEYFSARHLVVGLDESRTAEEILPEVREWMTAFGCTCTIVHVESTDEPSLSLDDEAADRIARMVQPFVEAGAELTVVRGDEVPAAILALVDDRPGTILALATHGRSGLSRLAAGSITMEVVADAPVPVLVRSATQL